MSGAPFDRAALRDRLRAHAQTPHPGTNAALVPLTDLLAAASWLDHDQDLADKRTGART